MKIIELKIENYRSLRNISFRPNDLTVIVGANGSGKSNLASAFEFLSDVFETSLEYAVLSKGGFENVAFRRQSRTKSAVKFSMDFLADQNGASFMFFDGSTPNDPLRIKHTFAFGASRQTIKADYRVIEERIEVFFGKSAQSFDEYLEFKPLFSIVNEGDTITHQVHVKGKKGNELTSFLDFVTLRGKNSPLNLILRDLFWLGGLGLNGISVHQFSPQISRTPGAPSPLPKLTSYGQNLATLVDWLQRNHPVPWASVEDSMRQIIPGLESIRVEFSTNNLLTLSFKEEGSGRPWSSQDVSDGTIQTLAILCCLADPRVSLLFLEEPENSVHPWIVRQLAAQFKKHSVRTQTILTTHSPVILNVVLPSDVWICHKEKGETMLSHLPELYPDLVGEWENGEGRLFDLFDMGLVREAMPKGEII
ncbi:AAA family ATPase [Burkholderia gladioli]|uniref:AAA family ATPase n=1 Tax=Burkholderia gladioli TaxID=28095 RepID=UPI0016404E23|nr:AAA family ATPase [Burkholderia gladioli]